MEAVLINTAGGLTGGDRLSWSVELGAGAEAIVTTQACEKIYRAQGASAGLASTLRVGRAGRLAWLPQETIVFDRCDFQRRLDAELAEDAELLVVEATLFGRTARNESVVQGRFQDRWRIRQSGRLAHAEDFAVGPHPQSTLARNASTGGAVATATLLLVAPDAAALADPARALIGDAGGASAWTAGRSGKLLARLVAADGYALRRTLVPLIELLNRQASLPKVWSL